MSSLTFGEINDDVLGPLKPPRPVYFAVMGLLATLILCALVVFTYQVLAGMGVTGLNQPVGWAPYVTNFVFWVGIAHSGTLISAILYLVHSRWRSSVARSAEAMTVFAVMTAGLFPLIHLGRIWVFYYIFPYPSERQLWPDFLSPLVWDVCAVSTYMTVSSIFWYIGVVPDMGAARDRMARLLSVGNLRSRIYRRLALGWDGSGEQWRHFGRGYLFFAALATPLVVSVHSVVSWDFAMSLLPGWHTTIFAPYFVAGAIFSGLAMVLTLLIPMRRLLHLERLISVDDFEAAAKTMVVMALVLGYAYLLEPFIAWYSGDLHEQQFAVFRATGWIAFFYWMLPVCNVLVPMVFLLRRARRSLWVLFIVSILANVGMWTERLVIIAASLSHDFLPHNWYHYSPRWVEITITVGSFGWFLFWFFGFAKLVPTVAISDVKEKDLEKVDWPRLPAGQLPPKSVRGATSGVLALFRTPTDLLTALAGLRATAFDRYEYYSPLRLKEAERIVGRGPSPVRLWTLVGALSGLAGGFALAIGSALVNNLIAGAKWPVSPIPYCIVGFEGTILMGTLANLAGVLVHARLGPSGIPHWYDERFSRDRYGLFVACEMREMDAARQFVAGFMPDELKKIMPADVNGRTE